MTYLIGAILVLLLIALVLVFRPPKVKPYEDVANREINKDEPLPANDQLDLEIKYGGQKTVEDKEGFELTLDEPGDAIGTRYDEEELDLVFDSPGPDLVAAEQEFVEELDLVLEEEGDDDESEDE